MAAPTNTPSTEDIWHLNIEDLFAPLPEKTRLGGPGPFVINLSASSAPIDVPAKGIAGCPQAHVYQVQRIEDRRPRYRLRLGPFAREDDADTELLKVRAIYPGALTATADADDLRIIAALQVKAPRRSRRSQSTPKRRWCRHGSRPSQSRSKLPWHRRRSRQSPGRPKRRWCRHWSRQSRSRSKRRRSMRRRS